METITFLQRFLGTSDTVSFLIYSIFAVLGIALASWAGLRTRDKDSDRTPIAFSWSIFWRDNYRKWGATFLLVFAFLRFTTEITGFDINEFAAFCVGVSIDSLMLLLKKKTSIFDMR